MNDTDLQKLSTQIYGLDSQLEILNISLKEVEAFYSNSNINFMKLKDELKKLRQLDDSDINTNINANTKPDDTSIITDREAKNAIIDSFKDAKNLVQQEISDLIGYIIITIIIIIIIITFL